MAWDPENIVRILRKCGTIAVELQNSAERSIKADGTVLTEADRRVEQVITESLQSGTSSGNPLFIGEETSQLQSTDHHHAALKSECYVIDPIDGTTLYANCLPGWGISIGYMLKGLLSEGAILFPISGELLISRGSEVLYASCPGTICPDFDDLVALDPPALRNTVSPVITVNQAVVKQGSYKGRLTVLSTGSCVSSILYLAQGAIMGYITQSRLWDMAGGMPLLSKLGMSAYSVRGKELPLKISSEYWHISPANVRMLWMIREQTVFCAHKQAFESIIQDTTLRN